MRRSRRPSSAPPTRRCATASRRSTARSRAGALRSSALGRLGSRELTADSDLDLVVLYDFDEDRRESLGAAPARCGRLLHAADAAARRGADRADPPRPPLRRRHASTPARRQGRARLRSSRASSPIEQDEAELWEHMALDPRSRDRRRRGVRRGGRGRDRRDRRLSPRARQGCGRGARHARADRDGEGRPGSLGPEARAGRPHRSRFPGAGARSRPRERSPVAPRAGEPAACSPRPAGLGSCRKRRRNGSSKRIALFAAMFQWQRLAIAGPFDATSVPPAILQRLAAVVGLPDAKVLLRSSERDAGRGARKVFSRGLDAMADLARREER